jgi:hypothetical protein
MRCRLQELSLTLALALTACTGPFEPGDRVAARWQEAFYEGTVLSLDRKLLMVQWDQPPPEKSGLPVDWAVRLQSKVDPRVGGWLLCPSGKRWTLCQVRAAQGTQLDVSAVEGDPLHFRADELLPLPAGCVEWAAKLGPQLAHHARTVEQLPQAAPASVGQPAAIGTLILARWQDGNWWEATVASLEGQNTLVAWKDGSSPTLVDTGEVAPVHPLAGGLEEGELLICRWKKDTRWWRAAVDKAHGAAIDLTWEDGTTGRASAGDCIRAR